MKILPNKEQMLELPPFCVIVRVDIALSQGMFLSRFFPRSASLAAWGLVAVPNLCAASSRSIMGQERDTGLTIFFGSCHLFLFVRSQHFFQMCLTLTLYVFQKIIMLKRKTTTKNPTLHLIFWSRIVVYQGLKRKVTPGKSWIGASWNFRVALT